VFGDLLSAVWSTVALFVNAVRDLNPEEYFLLIEKEFLMKRPCPVKSFLH
jgi:hypothetical protein